MSVAKKLVPSYMTPTSPMLPAQLAKPVAKSVPPVSGRVKLLNA
jgi:hypothetical protein